jgi:hypothetical protein
MEYEKKRELTFYGYDAIYMILVFSFYRYDFTSMGVIVLQDLLCVNCPRHDYS